jgi:hypothetical protein
MMKATIALGAALLLASSAFADVKQDSGPIVIQGGLLDCTGAASLTCGDVATGTLGAAVVGTYGCTTLSYSACGETAYAICVGADDTLTVTMTYAHSATNDLDAFLLGSCNEADCLDSATGTTGTEVLGPQAVTAGTYYVVVDGWSARCDNGAHTVSVACSSPCTPVSVEEATWGSVKGLYSN